MGRTKGAKGKHHKEKPHKEKKKKGRPKGSIKQKQSQSVNININGGGGDSNIRKPSLPVQLPLSIYDPSLIQSNYGINNRQPVNPLTDSSTDLLTPFLQAMVANQQHIQQPIQQQPRPIQPPVKEKPIKEKPVKTPVKEKPIQPIPQKPEIIKPPVETQPHYNFTHDDVHKYVEKIHEKDKVVQLPPNEPEPVNKGLVDNIVGFVSDAAHKLVSEPEDKYDGLKIKTKTVPVRKLIKTSIEGGIWGIASGIAGKSFLNNAVVTAGGVGGGLIGSELDGERGAFLGTVLGSVGSAKLINKFNAPYPELIRPTPELEGYEEIPNGSLVNGGTVIATGRKTTTIKSKEKPLHTRLFNAIKETNTTPATTQEVQQKVKESRILKEIESKQKYGTINTDIIKPEPQPSTLENIKEGVKKIYRRLSGKGGYEKVPTHDESFDETLKKTRKTKQGTYAILPQEEEIDIEKELKKMKTPKQNKTPVKEWSAMKRFGERNEKSIRESIERVDKEERKKQNQDDINEHVRQLLEGNIPKKDLAKTLKSTEAHSDLSAARRKDIIPKKEKLILNTNVKAIQRTLQPKKEEPSGRLMSLSEKEFLKSQKASNKIKQAYKRRLQRVEARHELDKSRQTFDPEQYQLHLRESLKKANDKLSHYRTRYNPELLTNAQKKAIEKAKTKIKSIEMLAKAKATGRPIGTRKAKSEGK